MLDHQYKVVFESGEMLGTEFVSWSLISLRNIVRASLSLEGEAFFRAERSDGESIFFHISASGACIFESNEPEYIFIHGCSADLSASDQIMVTESSWQTGITIPENGRIKFECAIAELERFLNKKPPSCAKKYSQLIE